MTSHKEEWDNGHYVVDMPEGKITNGGKARRQAHRVRTVLMYHAIETLIKWCRGRQTTVLDDILGAVALFAMLFILLLITP